MLKFLYSTWLIVVLTIIYLFQAFAPHIARSPMHGYSLISTDDLQPSFEQDTLTYQQFRALDDSLKRIEKYRKLINDGVYGSGGTFGHFGYREYSECDTCSPPEFMQHGPVKHYFELTGYYLEDPSEFFIRNGKHMLRYPVWDSATLDKKTGDTTSRFGHYQEQTLSYRFVKDSKKDAPLNRGSVLIPVKNSTYEMVQTLLSLATTISVLLAVYAFMIVPVRLLIEIARGKAFKPWHYKKLYLIAAIAMIFTFLPILLKYALQFFFRNYLDNNVGFYFIDVLKSTSEMLVTSIVLLIIAKAFKKGYELQNEQEHTI